LAEDLRASGIKEERMTDSFWAKQRKRFSGIAGLTIILAVLPRLAAAQVTTTTVQGTVYRADGSAATGTVLVSWPAFSTALNQAVAAGSTTAKIGQDGFLRNLCAGRRFFNDEGLRSSKL
jgi:hypothetical protein